MTSLVEKERQRFARSRASKIREGMRNYIATLGEIHAAWVGEDWKTLGYDSWQSYIDGEFGADRVHLPAEHRRKAVEELRLAGMSTRAIGDTLGVSRTTVKADLREVGQIDPPAEVVGADGKTYAPKSPLVEAMTEAIEDATDRAQDHRDDTPGEADPPSAGEGVAAPSPNQGPPAGPGAADPPSAAATGAASSTAPVATSDANLHAALDEEMAGTAVRFRANFSAAVAKADDVWQFDAGRIAEVYAADFDRELGPFLREMRDWCDRVEREHAKRRSGLRLVGGAR